MDPKSSRIEYGWAGHFCCADRCLFRRNTHIKYKKREIVVSTVGKMITGEKFEPTVGNAIFETEVFESDYKNKKYHDADVSINLDSDRLDKYDDMEANYMHERMVSKWMKKIMEP